MRKKVNDEEECEQEIAEEREQDGEGDRSLYWAGVICRR